MLRATEIPLDILSKRSGVFLSIVCKKPKVLLITLCLKHFMIYTKQGSIVPGSRGCVTLSTDESKFSDGVGFGYIRRVRIC